MQIPSQEIDIAIIGGGVAGLWVLNQLRASGYSALLFESQALGSGQSIATQGIIHSGIKYALDGSPSEHLQTLAGMPQAWRDCMTGRGSVDLTGLSPLHNEFILWTATAFSAKLRVLLASQRNHSLLSPEAYPRVLSSPLHCSEAYRLDDFVIDSRALLESLAAQSCDSIYHIKWDHAHLRVENSNVSIELPNIKLSAQQVLFCAGEETKCCSNTLARERLLCAVAPSTKCW